MAVDWTDTLTGDCALHITARTGTSKRKCTFLQLIETGADLGKVSRMGYNALHMAAWSDSVECVDALMQCLPGGINTRCLSLVSHKGATRPRGVIV